MAIDSFADGVSVIRARGRRRVIARSITSCHALGTRAEAAHRTLVGAVGDGADGRVEVRVRVAVVRGALLRGADSVMLALAASPNSVVISPGSSSIDVDAEAAHLEAQRVGDRLQRVLGRVVAAAAGERQPPAHRADVDDPAPALRAHLRQHQLREAHEPEHVRLELAAHGLASGPSRSRRSGCSRRC